MGATFHLVAVAFLRSAGGRVRVLLAIDRDAEQLFDGEPALLVEHRPGSRPGDLEVECADRIPPAAATRVLAAVAPDLVELVEAAFDDLGQLDGSRLLGRSVRFESDRDTFG